MHRFLPILPSKKQSKSPEKIVLFSLLTLTRKRDSKIHFKVHDSSGVNKEMFLLCIHFNYACIYFLSLLLLILGSFTRIKDLHFRAKNLLPNTDEYMTYEGNEAKI